jgi:endonuclease-3
VLEESPLPAVSEVAARREDPFAVLVSTMISLRTKDEVTAASSFRLLARAPTAKARHLKQAALLIAARHGGRVPQSMEDLLALPGVGRKTANLVRNLGYGLPGICVDTHVHRITNRLGWVRTRTPLETERALEAVLPRRWWIPVNGLLVAFGQRTCTPQSPKCSTCPIRRHCARVGVARSR